MNRSRNRQEDFEATMVAIAALPEDRKAEAMLQLLTNILRELPVAALRSKRDQLLERFSQCGGSFELCCAIQDLVDLHLAQREQAEKSQVPERQPDSRRTTYRRFSA